MKKVSIVVPCYNESSSIVILKNKLDEEIKGYQLEFLFIDDGSTDDTLKMFNMLSEQDKRFKFISFSRNFGHQNALKAGIDNADGDCLITMDADMQHNPAVIVEMLGKWEEGYDIVYTIVKSQKSLPFFKRTASRIFNRLFSYLSDSSGPAIGSDFRLIDRKIADILKSDFQEFFLFYRGIIGWIGYNQYALEYIPENRIAGESKYSNKKMFSFALNGITSFSTKPLRIITILGLIISSFAFLYGIYALYIFFFTDKAITGWSSVILSILLIGGLQLVFLGIIGEYIGKLFFEIKRRPNYLIKTKNF